MEKCNDIRNGKELCYSFDITYDNHCSALYECGGNKCPFYKARSVRLRELKEMEKRAKQYE